MSILSLCNYALSSLHILFINDTCDVVTIQYNYYEEVWNWLLDQNKIIYNFK